ncbi:MAG: hypothetical protein QXX30_03620 [Candidatus Aenigmatarchaeota archaeon]
MKGDVSPIIYVLIAIAVAIVAIVLLLNRSTIFTSSISKADCEAKIAEACTKYSSLNDASAFNNIPSICDNFFPQLAQCRISKNVCNELCEKR